MTAAQRRREDPAPAAARSTARRVIPREHFRGVAVSDLGWDDVVAAFCLRFDTRAPRLWGPRVAAAVILSACVHTTALDYQGGTVCERAPLRSPGCDVVYSCRSGALVWYTAGNEPDSVCRPTDAACRNASFLDAFAFSCGGGR